MLVKIVKGERVVASLRECSQVLEMLLVLGVDTKQFILEKNEASVVVKKGKVCEASDSGDEERNMLKEDEVSVVYEGQSSNVARAEIEMDTGEDSGLSEPSRLNLTPPMSPIPPSISSTSCSESSSFCFQDLVRNRSRSRHALGEGLGRRGDRLGETGPGERERVVGRSLGNDSRGLTTIVGRPMEEYREIERKHGFIMEILEIDSD